MSRCFPFPPLGYEKKTRTDEEIKPDKKDVFVDNKIIKQYTGNNGEMVREINHLAKENKDSKFLLEFERIIKEGNGAAGNQLVQKFTNSDHRKDEGTVRLLARNSGTLRDDSEKLKDKGFYAKKIEGKGINAQVRPFGNATVQNHTGNFHPKADGVPKLLGKYMDRNLEATVGGKEKRLYQVHGNINISQKRSKFGNAKRTEKKKEKDIIRAYPTCFLKDSLDSYSDYQQSTKHRRSVSDRLLDVHSLIFQYFRFALYDLLTLVASAATLTLLFNLL
ncbi:unnamed protein product [Vicia faba]|uniref:Uncharacterized protein n=1 Tax=Vicia faba TaxID=3906 RepID=A0AAV0YC75_VICFA|nr:unnamed protein product [Vicia faba]